MEMVGCYDKVRIVCIGGFNKYNIVCIMYQSWYVDGKLGWFILNGVVVVSVIMFVDDFEEVSKEFLMLVKLYDKFRGSSLMGVRVSKGVLEVVGDIIKKVYEVKLLMYNMMNLVCF